MFDYLDTLRKKPPHVRMQITYVTTSVLFALIALIWWSTWRPQDPVYQKNAAPDQSPVNVVTEAISGMKEETVSSWRDTVANLEQLASSSENVAATGQTTEPFGSGSNKPALNEREGIE